MIYGKVVFGPFCPHPQETQAVNIWTNRSKGFGSTARINLCACHTNNDNNNRGHVQWFNWGPLNLQSSALPLSYIHYINCSICINTITSIHCRHLKIRKTPRQYNLGKPCVLISNKELRDNENTKSLHTCKTVVYGRIKCCIIWKSLAINTFISSENLEIVFVFERITLIIFQQLKVLFISISNS